MIKFNSKLKDDINLDFLSTYPYLFVLSKKISSVGLQDDLVLINFGNNKPILEFSDEQFNKSKFLQFNGEQLSIKVFDMMKIGSFSLSKIFNNDIINKNDLCRVGFVNHFN